ncbi:MAG: hypothetical protein K0R14_2201 [Burkholderiales bacterium]|jgi:hypothetical protein|nr:hypothetical protein [Burkholderiales bacterium]
MSNIKMKNPGNDKKLKNLVSTPKRLVKELFVRTDANGENLNPSGQQNYPGPRKQKS